MTIIPACIRHWLPVSTHMPLARHDFIIGFLFGGVCCFYSHASCEAWLSGNVGFCGNKVSTHMPLARHDSKTVLIFSVSVFLLTCLLRGMTDTGKVMVVLDEFLLTCLLRGMTRLAQHFHAIPGVSTHMPLARHDSQTLLENRYIKVSTHMPLARHDAEKATP